MKQCSQCRQTYPDDTHFCLSDGTPLVFLNDSPEEATVFLPIYSTQEEVTFVKPHREEITVVRSAQNTQPNEPTARQGVSPIFAYLTVGLLLLVVGGGIILAGIFVISQMLGKTNTETAGVTNKIDNGQNKIDDQQANLRKQQDLIEKEREKLANERKKLNEEKNKTTPIPPIISTPQPTPPSVTPPPPTPLTNYPPQPLARIKFGRGRVAESVSGKVYTQRSFVLEARNGQYLSASVNGGGCVTFFNGGTSIGYVTNGGDNRLTIVNSCNTASSFSLTVSIK